MDCRLCQPKLSLYLEKELNRADREEVENHLKACSRCSTEIDALKALIVDLKKIPAPAVPVDFRQQVWNRIDTPHPDLSTHWARCRQWLLEPWYLKLPVEALATAAVVLLAVQISRQISPDAVFSPQTKIASQLEEENQLLFSGNRIHAEADYRAQEALEEKTDRLDDGKLYDKAVSEPARQAVPEMTNSTRRKREAPAVLAREMQTVSTPAEFPERIQEPLVHVRVRVKDLSSAVEGMRKILSEIPVERQLQPAPSRYYLKMTPAQFTVFMGRLFNIGEPESVVPLKQFPSDFPSVDKDIGRTEEGESPARSVILDLVP